VNYEKNSLLNKKNIKITMKTLANAQLDYIGIKLQVLPQGNYLDLNRELNNNYNIITSQS
jgi:hypothetical protein